MTQEGIFHYKILVPDHPKAGKRRKRLRLRLRLRLSFL